MKYSAPICKGTAGFTLAEVLAALVLMGIVVPVAIAALRVASLSGEVAERKATAARIADRVLNEAVVTANAGPLAQKGTVTESGRPFRWVLRSESWPVALTSTSAMQVLTVDVTFSAQGQDYVARLSTLVNGT
jgi:prepilin-type N-terminal cleavage/methylation domain-containing protein